MRRTWRKILTTMLALMMTSSTLLGVKVVEAQTTDYVQDPSILPSEQEQLQRKIVGYFPSWAYKKAEQGNFMVTDLQWDDLTHIQYSFAGVDPKTNKIFLLSEADEYAATKEDFSDYKANIGPILHNGKPVELDASLPYKGHFNLLQVMKKQYPDVKVVISVGGWAASTGFYTMMDTDAGINTFADSCVDFIRKYGLDGVDIDFEYPTATPTAGNPNDQHLAAPRRAKLNERYNVMMKILRQKLDQASKEDGKYYSLSAAVAASAWVLGGVTDGEYAQYLDFLSVMSYDFHGAWNGYVGNLANIYMDPNDPETEGQARDYLAMEWAYDYYRGVLPPEKILMGIPYYTRGWEKVRKAAGAETGLYGTAAKTMITERGWGADKECNIWGDDDDGDGWVDASGANPLWHVLNLRDADPNYVEYWDNNGKVPYIWNEERDTFLSWESERSIRERAKFIEEKNLGGALIWVMNGDYGLNPNYDPNYDPTTADRNDPSFNLEDVNKGKYTFGDTLTETLRSEFDRMGLATRTTSPWDTLETIDVEVDMDVKYDHPNGTYTFTVVNNTNEKIEKGWKIEFDFPKSADFTSCWGADVSQRLNGDFNHITLTDKSWNGLEAGAKIQLQGMTKLCFSGIQNITFNGKKPINWATGDEGKDKVLPLKGSVNVVPSTTTLATYDVVATIPLESKATSYELYENNQVIKSGVVDPQSPMQDITHRVIDQVPGLYSYRLDLVNAEGVTTSNIANHEVPAPKELAAATVLTETPITNTGAYDVTVTIPAESQATTYTVFENGIEIKSGQVDPEAVMETVLVINKTNQVVGEYVYTVKLANESANTESNTLVVQVIEEQIDPLLKATVKASTTSTDTGAYDVTITIPANSQATSYKVYENNQEVQSGQVEPAKATETVIVLSQKDKAIGTYTYTAELVNDTQTTKSDTVAVEVVQKQEDPLLKATVTASTTSTDTGAYDVTITIPANSQATSYQVYENNEVIQSNQVDPTSQASIVEVISKTNQPVGKYTYKVELTNDTDVSTSNVVTVEITEKEQPVGEKPSTPSISHNNWDNNGDYEISFNMWWGVNGTEWKLYEDGKLLHTGALTPNGKAAQSGTYKVTGKEAGSYVYYMELINDVDATPSNEITVKVAGDTSGGGQTPDPEPSEAPGKPSVSHNNWDNNGDYEISFNMWWGINGTEWKLYEDGELIHTKALTPNGKQAQSGVYKITNQAPGTYTYKVELINSQGISESADIIVTVK